MKPTTDNCIVHERQVSTSSADIKTFTLPRGTSHVEIQVEDVNARITYDGSAPSATNGFLFIAGQPSAFRPLGQGSVIKAASVGASSAIQIAYLS